MTILLLGGTGYLGSNIATRLVKDGCDVICIVRPTTNVSRLDRISGNKKIRLISNDAWQIKLVLRQEKIDWVINCACIYKPNDSLYGDMLEGNIVFPLLAINYALQYGVKNFITIGTSLPSDINAYSFTKSKLSEFGKFFAENNGVRFIELRLEMFYGGEDEPDNRFIKNCAEKLRVGETLLLTEGTQRRDIVRVEDVLEIVTRLLSSGFGQGYKILPIGSGEAHSIRDIVIFMKEIMNSTSDLKFGAIPSRVGEPDTIADINWYKKINYELNYGYFDGLKDACSRIYTKNK